MGGQKRIRNNIKESPRHDIHGWIKIKKGKKINNNGEKREGRGAAAALLIERAGGGEAQKKKGTRRPPADAQRPARPKNRTKAARRTARPHTPKPK